MKVYNKEKNTILENYDLEKGYLKEDKLFVAHHEAQEEIQEQFHHEVVREYENGGKDVKKVIDVEYQPAKEAWDEYEDIQVYVPYTEEELLEREKQSLRHWREQYFNIIDRAAWYDSLTDSDKAIVQKFRIELLDITKTMKKPQVPEFIASQLK